jgi:hypothetical protein
MLNNITLANGEVVSWQEFSSWPAKTQALRLQSSWSKGTSLTPEHKANISATLKGRSKPRTVPVTWGPAISKALKGRPKWTTITAIHTPDGDFVNRAEYAKWLTINRGFSVNKSMKIVVKWLRQQPDLYWYIK